MPEPRSGRRRLPPALFSVILLWLFVPALHAQDVSFEPSTIHDGNIFDIYAPQSDQITQLQLDASHEWDFDQSTLNLGYSGSLLLFNTLAARNYHIHVLTFSANYHFESEDEDDPSGDEEDSTGAERDSASAQDPASLARTDSSGHYLEGYLFGAGQFNKQDYNEYDNDIAAATLAFRQPIGDYASVRPAYTLSYHAYPNVSGLTNVQNVFGLIFGTDVIPGGWLMLSPSYSIKDYTTTALYYYSVRTPNSSGRGKGGEHGGGTTVQRSIELSTPSVTQAMVTLGLVDSLPTGTHFTAQYTRFGTPSTEARSIPQQLHGALESGGTIGSFTAENEIFDDHFLYSGDRYVLQVQQHVFFNILLTTGIAYQTKTYTDPAKDLSDSLIVASHRQDWRTEIELNLSRPLRLGDETSIKPELDFRYLRNSSNAPYYDFDKSVIMAGIELDF